MHNHRVPNAVECKLFRSSPFMDPQEKVTGIKRSSSDFPSDPSPLLSVDRLLIYLSPHVFKSGLLPTNLALKEVQFTHDLHGAGTQTNGLTHNNAFGDTLD